MCACVAVSYLKANHMECKIHVLGFSVSFPTFSGHCAVNRRARVFVPVEHRRGGVCRLACHEAQGTNPPAPHCRIQVK